jgi:serine/threonine protein kinase
LPRSRVALTDADPFFFVQNPDPNRSGHRANNSPTPIATRAPALSNFHRSTPFTRWNGGEKYNILCEVGKGSFATVYKIATKSSGDVFAAKQVSRNGLAKGATPGRVENEIDIIKEMNHVSRLYILKMSLSDLPAAKHCAVH